MPAQRNTALLINVLWIIFAAGEGVYMMLIRCWIGSALCSLLLGMSLAVMFDILHSRD